MKQAFDIVTDFVFLQRDYYFCMLPSIAEAMTGFTVYICSVYCSKAKCKYMAIGRASVMWASEKTRLHVLINSGHKGSRT